MSSILFVEVVDKGDDALTLLLVEIQEGFVFVASPTLALQLLLESWRAMEAGNLVNDLQAASRGGFYCPFSVGEAQARAARSPIREVSPDPFDERRFVEENALRYVRSIALREERHMTGLRGARMPTRHRFGPHAECLFCIQAADPRWLDHLEQGICWDTTAYPYERG